MASQTTPQHGQQQQQQQQQPQHVVQTILESFAKCFSPPFDDARGVVVGGGGGVGVSGFSRTVSRSLSSSDSRNGGAARCPLTGGMDAHHHATTTRTRTNNATVAARRKPSAEELEERSMKRKLEIFRGNDGGGWSRDEVVGHKFAPPRSRRRPPNERRHGRLMPQQPHRQSGISPQTAVIGSSDLVSSEEEEDEVLRLAQSSRGRFACGSPITSIGKMFGDMYGMGYAASNGFLCFATPVRSVSGEGGVVDLDDDDLTADEYKSRHGGEVAGGGAGGGGLRSRRRMDPPTISGQWRGMDGGGGMAEAIDDPPDSSTYCGFAEEESANSTFYFDQKYSHVVQTRPPMPLFQENMLGCSEDGRVDELLSSMLKRAPTIAPRTSNMGYEYEYSPPHRC
jgi:hypothetical protein